MQYDFIVVDSYNMAYRQWWGVKDLSHNGVPTGLEFGFIKKIVSLMKQYPSKVYLAWDGCPTRCNALVEGYKSNRVKVNGDEPDWTTRLQRLREIFSNLCHTLYHPEEEADEQIAKFVISNPHKKILILSNDKDFQQMITSTVHVETKEALLEPANCMEKWGVPTYKIALFKALDGDASDNIDGVPRLLTKTKLKLVNMSETIDELVANFQNEDLTVKEREKLATYKDQVILSYKLVNLLEMTGNPTMISPNGDKTELQKIVQELGFSSIVV